MSAKHVCYVIEAINSLALFFSPRHKNTRKQATKKKKKMQLLMQLKKQQTTPPPNPAHTLGGTCRSRVNNVFCTHGIARRKTTSRELWGIYESVCAVMSPR